MIDIVINEHFSNPALSNREREKVLWLLDGYDEIPESLPQNLVNLRNELLDKAHHILTSRPYGNNLPDHVKMEITGFTDENITKYVDQFFDQIKDEFDDAPSKGQKLQSFLKSNLSIWGVAHIPINLELMCSLWGDNDFSKNNDTNNDRTIR